MVRLSAAELVVELVVKLEEMLSAVELELELEEMLSAVEPELELEVWPMLELEEMSDELLEEKDLALPCPLKPSPSSSRSLELSGRRLLLWSRL